MYPYFRVLVFTGAFSEYWFIYFHQEIRFLHLVILQRTLFTKLLRDSNVVLFQELTLHLLL
jgi:hypothetical protein